MNRIYKQLSIFLFITLIISSCTETIDVDVPNGGARLVVEASINWEKGTTGQNQMIRLSLSTPYFSANTEAPAVGATVKVINDNTGAEFDFQDQGNGVYATSSFIPELNATYLLDIIYEGETYFATETLISVVDLSSVEQTIDGGDSDSDIEVTVYFDDPANEDNYYLGEFIPSIEPLLTLEPLSDSFTDGNQNFMEFENEEFEAGDSIDINLYGISENYYNYINLLVNQTGEGGGPFTTTPAQLKGNCKNLTNPNKEVLGYFRLGEVVKTTHVIQ